jgi:trehalose transport system permease protein
VSALQCCLEYGNPHTSAASSTALLLTLGAKTMPLQVYYYLYQGNWFDTAVAATLMTVPVLALSAFLQRYLRETSLAGVMR